MAFPLKKTKDQTNYVECGFLWALEKSAPIFFATVGCGVNVCWCACLSKHFWKASNEQQFFAFPDLMLLVL